MIDEEKKLHIAIMPLSYQYYIYIIRHKSKHKYDRNLEETNLKFQINDSHSSSLKVKIDNKKSVQLFEF